MVLAAATLASVLANMAPTDAEGSAIQAFVDAWEAYFDQSSVGGITATPGSYAAALSAMAGAMSGCSSSGQGAAKIAAAISAFWSALSAVATTVWVTAPVVLVPPIVPPASLPGLAYILGVIFALNTSQQNELAAAASNVASNLHSNGGLGATILGSVPPAAPAPIPIL